MDIVIAKDRKELGKHVAQKAAEALKSVLADQEECNLVIATGSSQFEILDCLVREEGIDWSRVHGFHLDEYLGIGREHPASFCGYLEQRFVSKVALGSFHYMDGQKPQTQLLEEACTAIANKKIDLLLCGIGENGHLAFNDPPADFEVHDPYLIVELDEPCRRQQVGEGWFDSLEQVPTQAISMSVQQILRAERIFCGVPDTRKAEAVRNTVEAEISPAVPASILRDHDQTILVLDATSGSLLSEESKAASTILES
ncbi:MAG: glucosamine-6-phosphate deaminase [Planctomycetota bacterium]